MKKNVLLISNDKEVISFFNTTIMTLMKLNHQIDLLVSTSLDEILKLSMNENIKSIFIDIDSVKIDLKKLIKKFRSDNSSKNKKIISFGTLNDNIRNELNSYGCDSVMTRQEIMKYLNNILQF